MAKTSVTQNRTRAKRGRPRDPETDDVILAAAMRLLVVRGYRGMSIDAIASEAGVGKPTIYLRWASKEDIATAAVRALGLKDAPKPTGELRADLLAQLRHLRKNVERTVGMSLIGTLLAEEPEHPQLLEHFREQLVKPRRKLLRGILCGAVERGDLHPDADVESAIDLLVGSYYARYLAGSSFPRSWPEAQVDVVLAGLRAP